MLPIGTLAEAQEVFKTFKVTSSKIIDSDRVMVRQWIRFPVGCMEEAKETLTIQSIDYVHKDGGDSYGYIIASEVVEGPFKDGNREQMVDDCKIQTVSEIEPYIEGVTNRIDLPESAKTVVIAAKNKPATRSVALQEVPYQVEVQHGCRSNDASPWIILVMAVLLIQKKVRKKTA